MTTEITTAQPPDAVFTFDSRKELKRAFETVVASALQDSDGINLAKEAVHLIAGLNSLSFVASDTFTLSRYKFTEGYSVFNKGQWHLLNYRSVFGLIEFLDDFNSDATGMYPDNPVRVTPSGRYLRFELSDGALMDVLPVQGRSLPGLPKILSDFENIENPTTTFVLDKIGLESFDPESEDSVIIFDWDNKTSKFLVQEYIPSRNGWDVNNIDSLLVTTATRDEDCEEVELLAFSITGPSIRFGVRFEYLQRVLEPSRDFQIVLEAQSPSSGVKVTGKSPNDDGEMVANPHYFHVVMPHVVPAHIEEVKAGK